MKKIVTMLLVCVMVLGLFAGCGNGSTQQTTAPRCNHRRRFRRDGSTGNRGHPRYHRDHGPPCHRQLSGKPENLGR